MNPLLWAIFLVTLFSQVCLFSNQSDGELFLFASIDKAKFKKPVHPGDTMHLHLEFIKERRGMWKFYGEAKVDGKVVCSADLMCARRVI